jgi:hypothetical protein
LSPLMITWMIYCSSLQPLATSIEQNET